MKAYAVIQKYFNNGKVKAEIQALECDQLPITRYRERPTFDEYTDYFRTQEEATTFLEEALNA